MLRAGFQKQIQSLLANVPAATALNAPQTTWATTIIDQNEKKICDIFITLPAQFPIEAPIISLSKIFPHSWIDTNGSVAEFPGLQSWDVNVSNLGQVVQQIISELQKPNSLFPPVTSSSFSSRQSSAEKSFVKRILMPAYPRHDDVPDIGSKDETMLATNSDCIPAWIMSRPQVKCYDDLCSEIALANREMLNQIVTLRRETETMRSNYSKELDSLESIKSKVGGLLQTQRDLMERYSPIKLMDKLSTEITDKETSSIEYLQKAKCETNLDISEFRKKYFYDRLALHGGRAKLQKLQSTQL